MGLLRPYTAANIRFIAEARHQIAPRDYRELLLVHTVPTEGWLG